MRKTFSILGLCAISSIGYAQLYMPANCETEPYQIANNNVALFHAGASKGSDGIWYAWGENHGGATGVKEVNSDNYPNIPAGATAKYVSGGSKAFGTTFLNELVALLSNNTIVSLSDYTFSTTNQMVLQDKVTINLPTGVLTQNVTSFYAGVNVIAIVDGGSEKSGKAYVHDRASNYNSRFSYGDGGRRENNWGGAVRTSSTNIIEDFVSVRGASKGDAQTAFIGFTKSGKVYAWGRRIPRGNGAYTDTNLAIDITPSTEDSTAKPVLVGANYNFSGETNEKVNATFYVLFNNGEFYSIGNGERRQLGNFSIFNTNTWQRVRTSNNINSYADVTYFSTGEHDAQSNNYAPVIMMLRDKSLWAFGTNEGGILGIGETNGDHNPTITKLNRGSGINDPDTSIDLNGTTAERTALSVEMGGHINFIIRNILGKAQMSISGHGSNGSLLGDGSQDGSFPNRYSTSTDMPFTPCVPTPFVCYQYPYTGNDVTGNHGITLLQRAGTNNGNWPMARKSAHTVLESNTKGFVITRVTTAELANITKPQLGMMVYDKDDKCLKIYNGTAWKCFSTPSCYQIPGTDW
ncbi:MAG: hypothetical protein Q4G16_06330 [Cruoricaptor ignavus]|nr:hypothetical protein [Cruoricaptor ignavus]